MNEYPELLVWDHGYLLRYVLTFSGSFSFTEICTNYSEDFISKHIRVLKCEKNTETQKEEVSPSIGTEKEMNAKRQLALGDYYKTVVMKGKW